MKTQQQKLEQQIDLQEKIQSAGFNIVNCGNCSSVVLHELNEKTTLDCPYCETEMDLHDCPDFLYRGLTLDND